MTGWDGAADFACFFLSVFAVADFFGGRRLATGFLAEGRVDESGRIVSSIDFTSLAKLLCDFTALESKVDGRGCVFIAGDAAGCGRAMAGMLVGAGAAVESS